MKNWRYRIDDRDFILSSEEHKKIQEAISGGKSLIYLREGTLIINTSFIRYVKDTDSPTEIEEKKHEELMKLKPEERGTFAGNYLGTSAPTNGCKPITGEDSGIKPCEKCNVPHFIPKDKKFCLTCAHREGIF